LAGRIYVASVDGYLHAIDAKTGGRIWRVDTLPDRGAQAFHYFVTGAPVLAGDAIVIGNGGSDFKGARVRFPPMICSRCVQVAFLHSASQSFPGKQDQPHLDAAVKTWPADYDWANGGGGYGMGTVLLTMPPYIWSIWEPGMPLRTNGENGAAGRSDELYVASIIAVPCRYRDKWRGITRKSPERVGTMTRPTSW